MKSYNYATPTIYFVTICTHEKKCIFGKPNHLNQYGKIAEKDLITLHQHYSFVHVEQAVVMPNHVHMLINIYPTDEKGTTLSSIIAAYKAGVSRQIHLYDPTIQIWQRSFHDHIPRNRESLDKIWHYIENNPSKWELDTFYSNDYL